jgi:hypothetical protein
VGFDLGLLLVIGVVAVLLTLVMRWVFSPSRPFTGRPASGPGADLGMLVPVLTAEPRARALRAKDRLSEQGIRCSMSRIDANSYDLLVFGPDLERATELLSG